MREKSAASDIVGAPFKYTAGPAVNQVSKITNALTLPLLAALAYLGGGEV